VVRLRRMIFQSEGEPRNYQIHIRAASCPSVFARPEKLMVEEQATVIYNGPRNLVLHHLSCKKLIKRVFEKP